MAQLVEQEKQAGPQVAHYTAEYRRSLEQGPAQPRWAGLARESAMAQFERLGFPTTRIEQWRFTSVAPIAERTFALAKDGLAAAGGQQTRALSAPIAHAVCVNGRFRPQLSHLETLPKGVQLLGLEAAMASYPTLVEPYLAKRSLTQTNAFTALNTAFLRDGIVLIVPARVVVEQPIELTFASILEGSGSVSHPRLLIVAGEASQATVLERYVGKGAAFTNAVGEVWLGANAVLDHYKLQRENDRSFHIGMLRVYADRSANASSCAAVVCPPPDCGVQVCVLRSVTAAAVSPSPARRTCIWSKITS